MDYLLQRHKRFYETALFEMEKGYYDLAAFNLEQSLQLFLKAELLKLGVEYPRSHKVRELLNLIYDITKCKEIKSLFETLALELGMLEDVYITSRYLVRDFSVEEVNRLKETVDKVIDVVSQCVG